MRKIPATMATQHPDNAFAPYWDQEKNPFVAVHKEIPEAVACFQDMGVEEYMWDWEGKHADAAVIDKLFTEYHSYFAQHRLGSDKFLTFRLPNIWEEKGYSLLQAMTVLLTSEDFARDLNFPNRPLFEVILPMTERADQLIQMHTMFEKLAEFKSRVFTPNQTANTDYLELIPLVESIDSQQNIAGLLQDYVKLHQRHFGRQPEYIRPFLARSDPALVSGLLATIIANKLALSRMYEFADSSGIPVFPIAGVGSLPFRGGITPDSIDEYMAEYPGMRTVSLQSSFRYDHKLETVKAAVAKLNQELPKIKPHIINATKQKRLVTIGQRAAGLYQETLGGIVGDVHQIFTAVPRRRERRQHVGLLAYGRSMGNQELPRAITFTAGFYSIGVPPEFIGIGRCMRQLSRLDLKVLQEEYHSLKSNLERAGRFLNADNLALLTTRNSAWKQVQQDVQAAQEVLGITFGPHTDTEKAHKDFTSQSLLPKNNQAALTGLITEMSQLRASLG